MIREGQRGEERGDKVNFLYLNVLKNKRGRERCRYPSPFWL